MKIYLARYLLILSAVTLLFSVVGVTDAKEHSESSIFQHTLTNGLEIIVKPDHRSPVAAIMLWYRAGSIDEVNGRTGIAHLLEHMMFQGTDTTGPGEHARKIAATGGRSNAFTSTDYTGYLQELHSSELELAMPVSYTHLRAHET